MAQADEESDAQDHEVVANTEHVEAIQVSTQDFMRILDLLEHPPLPNDKLKAAIATLPETL